MYWSLFEKMGNISLWPQNRYGLCATPSTWYRHTDCFDDFRSNMSVLQSQRHKCILQNARKKKCLFNSVQTPHPASPPANNKTMVKANATSEDVHHDWNQQCNRVRSTWKVIEICKPGKSVENKDKVCPLDQRISQNFQNSLHHL